MARLEAAKNAPSVEPERRMVLYSEVVRQSGDAGSEVVVQSSCYTIPEYSDESDDEEEEEKQTGDFRPAIEPTMKCPVGYHAEKWRSGRSGAATYGRVTEWNPNKAQGKVRDGGDGKLVHIVQPEFWV